MVLAVLIKCSHEPCALAVDYLSIRPCSVSLYLLTHGYAVVRRLRTVESSRLLREYTASGDCALTGTTGAR